jgi:TldD protein
LRRRDFIFLTGVGAGAMALPSLDGFGKNIDVQQALDGVDVRIKKQLADAGLNAAKIAGASYADVRIGRYLNQFVITRENRVLNVANTESYGVGIRVIADGCWGFAATNDVTKEGIAKVAKRAVAVAKANAKLGSAPVQLGASKRLRRSKLENPYRKKCF